jgi:hypothetical protein
MRTAGWVLCSAWIMVLAVSLAALGPAAAAGASAGSPQTSGARVPVGGTGLVAYAYDALDGVAATSSADAWAVGFYYTRFTDKTLIEHWNGRIWTRVASVQTGDPSILSAVAIASPSSAWAVGYCSNRVAEQTLIEHWNGRTWRRIPSPSPGGPTRDSVLAGVAVASPSSAWAVGYYDTRSTSKILIEHWNGRAWRLVASPNPGDPGMLTGVAVASSSSAWAVGSYHSRITNQILIEHWNGRAWRRVASPVPAGSGGNYLTAVTVGSPSSAWAVGHYGNRITDNTLIEHWNGRTWRVQASPSGGNSEISFLTGVVATSASRAWAVGWFGRTGRRETVIERWNGTAWSRVASANLSSPAHEPALLAIAAVPNGHAWTVGLYLRTNIISRTLIEHFDGRMWAQVPSLTP